MENSENKNTPITPEKTVRKQKYAIIILSVLLALTAAALGYIIYSNYDYIVFKTVMTRGYVYEDSLRELIDEELEQTDSDISESFDDTVISIFTEKLYEYSGDRYTHIYLPVEYTARIESEQEEGNSCQWFPFTDNSAYLGITNFTDESYGFVKENAADISEYGTLILDLRGNPGGYVSAVEKIADMFLENGAVIATEKAKMSFLSDTIKSKGDPVFDFEKIIILQDKNTASSAEILIGALRDNLDNVVLLGETTFGKGIGQYTMPLKNDYYFIATMFTWETPSGEAIHGKGIEPDREFTVDTLAYELGVELKENESDS